MGYWLNITKISIMAAACLSFTACTTVNMTEISSAKPEVSSKTADVNVVQRAASRLYSVFTNRGFVEKTSRNKMRSAARMLLKGLENKPLGADVNYAQSVGSLDIVKSDIIFAKSYVDQTRQAAEIYLAMAPGETSLKKELASLQKALVAASDAKDSFSEALLVHGSNQTQGEFIDYLNGLEALRSVTDDFGVRVRAMAMSVEKPSIG